MRVQTCSQTDRPRLTVVCCVHGNERYGLDVFEYFAARLPQYPGLKLILANEPALARDVRYVEQDLNRSFPGSADGIGEAGLAFELLRELADIPFVIDIHTTTSNLEMVPIVTVLNEGTRRLLRQTSSREVVLMESPFGDHSLLAHVSAGMSLEYGAAYAKRPETLHETIRFVQDVLAGVDAASRERDVFHVAGGIPKTAALPDDARNFTFIESLKAYPVLLHEAAYTDLHALAATKKETIVI